MELVIDKVLMDRAAQETGSQSGIKINYDGLFLHNVRYCTAQTLFLKSCDILDCRRLLRNSKRSGNILGKSGLDYRA